MGALFCEPLALSEHGIVATFGWQDNYKSDGTFSWHLWFTRAELADLVPFVLAISHQRSCLHCSGAKIVGDFKLAWFRFRVCCSAADILDGALGSLQLIHLRRLSSEMSVVSLQVANNPPSIPDLP